MAVFVILRHPVTTLVTAINNPNKLANDFLIFKLIVNKQIISQIKGLLKYQAFFYSLNEWNDLQALNVGPTQENLLLHPLAA